MMHEIKQLKTSQKSGKDEKPNEDNDVKKMKQDLKAKNKMIKTLNEQKSELANEINVLQMH